MTCHHYCTSQLTSTHSNTKVLAITGHGYYYKFSELVSGHPKATVALSMCHTNTTRVTHQAVQLLLVLVSQDD